MTCFVPELEPADRDPMRNVLDQALVRAPHPPLWVVAEEPSRRLVHDLAAVPAEQRSRSVVAAVSEPGMVAAARLGFGGAMWLPPSTVAMRTALAAAVGAPSGPPGLDVGLLDHVVSQPGELAVVAWPGVGFWRRQLGLRRLIALLVDLARGLDVLSALTADPALVVAAHDGGDIIQAGWERVIAARQVPTPPEVARLEPGRAGLSAVMAVLCELESRPAGAGLAPQPVHALPSGELACSWLAQPTASRSGVSGLASPVAGGECSWQVRMADGKDRTVTEVEQCDDLERARGEVVRVPGWLGAGARPGSPAGLLLERLVTATKRTGRTLWVPSVESQALSFLLRLGGRLWVDGPAVPSG